MELYLSYVKAWGYASFFGWRVHTEGSYPPIHFPAGKWNGGYVAAGMWLAGMGRRIGAVRGGSLRNGMFRVSFMGREGGDMLPAVYG